MAGHRRDPQRTCVGCRRTSGKRQLVRVVRGPEGDVGLDPSGRAPGRGAYVHPDAGCVAAAPRRGGLAWALRVGPAALEAGTLLRDLKSLEREIGAVSQ